MTSSLLLASWAAWYVLRQRRRSEDELRRSREHYRHLLEASPGAVALYDASLRVTEWNQAAERLYGFSKAEVIGRELPTVPEEKHAELLGLLRKADAGDPIAVVETRATGRPRGARSKSSSASSRFGRAPVQSDFLEVTEDIRERVRLRQTLLEIEKLTSIGKTAAGTAHHLNTPLAAMLLRVQMMRERVHDEPTASDLERLESSLHFCQHFVRRLLEFSSRPAAQKQPEDVARTLESVVSFLAPSLNARARARLDGPRRRERREDPRRPKPPRGPFLDRARATRSTPSPTAARSRSDASPPTADRSRSTSPTTAAASRRPITSTYSSPSSRRRGPAREPGSGSRSRGSIVLEHGGSIRLQDAPGGGTVATISLPVLQPGEAAGRT